MGIEYIPIAMRLKTRTLLTSAILFLAFSTYAWVTLEVNITDNVSYIATVSNDIVNTTENTNSVSPITKAAINNTETMRSIAAWIKMLDELNIKDRLFALLSIIVYLLLIILIYLLINWIRKDEGFFIQPFIVGNCSESYSGEAISNLLVTEYQKICEIYKRIEYHDHLGPHKDRITSSKLNISFPKIKPSSENPAFSIANIGISGGPVTPITISMGQLLNVLKRICCHPTNIIAGSIQEYGSMIYLAAWMGHSQIGSWEIKRSIDDRGRIKGENGIPGMVRELAFKIAIDTTENIKAKTWIGFKLYTEALDEYYQYKLTGEDVILEGAHDMCLRAARAELGYEEPIKLLYNLAVECLNGENYTKAEKLFLDSISLKPDAEAFFGLGVALYYLNRYTEAIDTYNKAIELDPEDARPWINKSGILGDLGKYEEAIEACNKAIELDPEDARPWINKGNALNDLGRYEEAIEACNKAIELDPEDARPWINKGNALGGLSRYEEALDACNRAIELDPEDAIAWTNKGGALGDLSRYGEALDACNRAIELNPEKAVAWTNKGVILNRLNRGAEAEACFSKAKALEL